MKNKKDGLMKSCETISELISLSKETEISWRQRFHIRLHLLFCRGCRHFQKNADLLSEMIKAHKKHH